MRERYVDRQRERHLMEEREGESRRAIIASLHGKLLSDVTALYKKAGVVCISVSSMHDYLRANGAIEAYYSRREPS